ncbi:unnamed protein product [Mytilus coruscus]|uniref:Uncharacterized protein n=1 Tax=Mytilus coruscus TaxID=42192 RepID=A0A6J8DXX0_MYTCO|nr:unnamed protein product [Mytilus coruscus]
MDRHMQKLFNKSEECENEEISSLQRWEKSDDWFHNYETEFKQEYNSENPFFKKIEKKLYAQAARQAPNRKTNKQSKYPNKYVNVEKVRPENTYNNRNRSSSTSRRNNFQHQQNQRNRFMQGNRNNNPTNNFRQNQQQRSQRYEQTQEIQILSKGLKFTPTPQTSNYNEVKDDISNCCIKLLLTEELFDKENRDESIVRNKSVYKSSKGKNKALDTFCDHITNFPFNEIQSPKCRPNTSRQEWKKIYKLKNNKDMIIKEADKGSAVVIMDLNYYINIANNLLQDNTYYEKEKNYNQSKIKKQIIIACIHLLRKGLTDKECDYLTNFKCKSSNFYGLPKIYKSNVIRESCKNSTSVCVNIPHPNDLKLRTIVAGPSCETHRLSNFLEIILKPILKHIPSFVRDDLDMLTIFPEQLAKIVSWFLLM